MLGAINQLWGYPEPFAMYAPKLVDPPAGSDLMVEWELFYDLARHLGLQLQVGHINEFVNSADREIRPPIDLDMSKKPSQEEMFEMVTRGSRVPLEEVKKHPNGALFHDEIVVGPKDPGHTAHLDVANAGMMNELGEVALETSTPTKGFSFLLISRRMAHVYNSSGRDLPMLIRKGGTYNPAFMHPDDLEALGIAAGDIVRISSPHGHILGIVAADDTLRRGLVSMSHSFGDIPKESSDYRAVGSNTNQLTDCADDYDRYSGIPRMSAVPVRVSPTNA